MKDANGLYYYPNPSEKSVRVYVRQGEAGPEFRLWHAKNEIMWEKHGWVPYGALKAAAEMYNEERGSGSSPLDLYDINVATALIAEDERKKPK